MSDNFGLVVIAILAYGMLALDISHIRRQLARIERALGIIDDKGETQDEAKWGRRHGG